MIDVKDLNYRYPGNKKDTIRTVNFSVKQGEIFGFLGPSGAGKSTLQKILSGINRPYRGVARVMGVDVMKAKSDYYEKIGVVFEFPNLYLKCTARENLMYFSSLYQGEKRSIKDLMARIGLADDLDKRVDAYSKGMRMRLAFVRALIHQPRLLFLDEPTSGLDPKNARIIKDIICEEKKRGTSVILTTHNMTDASELCDRVAFIVDGQIKALDTPKAFQTRIPENIVDYVFGASEQLEVKQCPIDKLGKDPVFLKAIKDNRLVSIHSKDRTLEDVFIELTGRELS